MSNDKLVYIKTKVQRWAEEINAAHGDSVAAIIAVGETLKRAKADCSHGEWGELTGRTTGKSLLPFSFQTAHRFQTIAANAALSNVAHARHLPASWYTLAVLASLDADEIEAAIADGDIHPEMERKDAEALKRRIKGPGKPPAAPPVSAAVLPLTPPPADEPLIPEDQAIVDAMYRDLAERAAEVAAIQSEVDERIRENRRLGLLEPDRQRELADKELGEVLRQLRGAASILRRSTLRPLYLPELVQEANKCLREISALIAR